MIQVIYMMFYPNVGGVLLTVYPEELTCHDLGGSLESQRQKDTKAFKGIVTG